MNPPRILVHPGNGDASFLIDGYKFPPGTFLLEGYEVDPGSPRLPVGVTDEVTALDLTRNPDRKDNP